MWGITAVLAKTSILKAALVDWAVGLNPCFYLQNACFVPVCFTHGNSLQTKWLHRCYFEGGCWDVTNWLCMTWCKTEGNAFPKLMYKAWNMNRDCSNLFRWGNLILLLCRLIHWVRIVQMFLSLNWANTFILWAFYTHSGSCWFGFFLNNSCIKTNSSSI